MRLALLFSVMLMLRAMPAEAAQQVAIDALALMTDGDNGGRHARAWHGAIYFYFADEQAPCPSCACS